MPKPKKDHRFGGNWTDEKLKILRHYLESYGKVFKKQTYFKTEYIDAFAGTGYRTPSGASPDGPTLFPDFEETSQQFLDGSARIALQVEPGFNSYIFIESSERRCAALDALKTDFPNRDIDVQRGDANTAIQRLCARDWKKNRAVLFLDPYGMQVEWKTIEAIATTQAIDMWLLFPLGIGVNRLLTKRAEEIPEEWQRRLDLFLGTPDWRDAFYKERPAMQASLFGGVDTERVKVSMVEMQRYFIDRLKSVFGDAGVPEPRVLYNSTNNPLYLFCFAAGNPKGALPAVRIANHILHKM